MRSLKSYIHKSKLSYKDIESVKNFLIEHYHVNSWKEYIDQQQYGQCKKICKVIKKQFPDLFDEFLLNIYYDFSDIAKQLINDDLPMNGNHYVLTKGKTMYDFARGTNCINGIYCLTQNQDNSDKYNILFTDKEINLINIEVKDTID